jgi:hypothetical protein
MRPLMMLSKEKVRGWVGAWLRMSACMCFPGLEVLTWFLFCVQGVPGAALPKHSGALSLLDPCGGDMGLQRTAGDLGGQPMGLELPCIENPGGLHTT